MRVLLLSTYELGHQPLGVAWPAAAVESAGHETRGVDLSLDGWPTADIAWAEAVAISIPMHTATRLGLEVLQALRGARPEVPVALHGLYAPAVERHPLLRQTDLLVAGDSGPAMVRWLSWLSGLPSGDSTTSEPPGVRVEIGPAVAPRSTPSPRPLRRGLPPLERYARLRAGERDGIVATVEASRGCNHSCKHCPVASIYRGRSRPVALDSVLGDIEQVVGMGATHISFADPDFLNRPRHSLEVAHHLHAAFPNVTFDATVKVSHVIRHRRLWPELAASGLIFIVSAFESVDDRVLGLLDKGHSASDEAEALEIARSAGVEVRPSWLPFTPWTTLDSYAALLEFSARNDLVWSTDPVQYSIRLLLPNGSLLLDDPDPVLAASLAGVEPDDCVSWSAGWVSLEPGMDDLQLAVASCAEESVSSNDTPDRSFELIWQVARAAGAPLPPRPRSVEAWLPGPERPHLTESWFCCAEPTYAQLSGLGVPAGLPGTSAGCR